MLTIDTGNGAAFPVSTTLTAANYIVVEHLSSFGIVFGLYNVSMKLEKLTCEFVYAEVD